MQVFLRLFRAFFTSPRKTRYAYGGGEVYIQKKGALSFQKMLLLEK